MIQVQLHILILRHYAGLYNQHYDNDKRDRQHHRPGRECYRDLYSEELREGQSGGTLSDSSAFAVVTSFSAYFHVGIFFTIH